MKKASPGSDSQIGRIRSWARSNTHGTPPLADSSNTSSTLPVSNPPASSSPVPLQSIAAGTAATHTQNHHLHQPIHQRSFPVPRNDTANIPPFPSTDVNGLARQPSKPTANSAPGKKTSSVAPPPAPPPQATAEGSVVGATQGDGDDKKAVKLNVLTRFWITSKSIILSSYVNLLLVFVPVGIASKAANLDPGIIFGMNAIAIVPLAGLLSHATESVAKRMGDTIGALMNVTFGNAVELIIFIALTKNEIRIVQASLLGSILANLLLILGMCFLVGGLRYREQIYNSTVTQMSACLLSLSVMSLLLPTAFHASFNTENKDNAEKNVLKVSRGTSVVLLLVYGMYLLFQLKSHAYMYESTPQHIIDEEMAPGPVAAWMDTDSDTSSSSSSSSSDSDHSNTTAKRIRKVMRAGRRHRKSSAGSKDTATLASFNKPTSASNSISPVATEHFTEEPRQMQSGRLAPVDPAEDGDDEKKLSRRSSVAGHSASKKERKKDRKRREKRERKARRNGNDTLVEGVGADGEKAETSSPIDGPRRVDFAAAQVVEPTTTTESAGASGSKRPFNIRAITHIRPQLPSAFSQNVFTQPTPASPVPHSGSIPRVRYGIRRTNSLPDRLNETAAAASRVQSQSLQQPARINSTAIAANVEAAEKDDEDNISRTTAVLLLLISTGLVAVCAEFLVDSISAVVESNVGISEAFIGLIILPIVGNAAEHVTAVTVAAKNKVDLAIGVAVGSSIQIALFVTPLIVLLGWAMGKDMSLYFTLFETVSLFVSAFIVNFLVLDGRSNYLEGALLCSSYVIIAICAFFYPNVENQSNLGGNADANSKMIRGMMGF